MKRRVAGPGAADPVLRLPELAGLRLASATAREQLLVHLANLAIEQVREAAAAPTHHVRSGEYRRTRVRATRDIDHLILRFTRVGG